ncbi:TPM domain-containing protein [Tenacibaculum sp. SDUM215027]|uniref:TPM domain-containing protein n=1 Tax=Tenacibaculum sp. SDUM215027 TaxID=3422596 RepID=UPI003D31C8EC
MKLSFQIIILALIFNLFSCKGSAQETKLKKVTSETVSSEIKKNVFPKPLGIVNDYELIFTEPQRNKLSKTLYDYDIETTRQIVVVTINSITPYQNIHRYATDLGNKWGVETKEKNNGLTIVLCKPCKQITIATGIGTEQILTNKICEEVIEKTIIPEFKKGEYYLGIEKGITELISKWE